MLVFLIGCFICRKVKSFWSREYSGEYLPPLSKSEPSMLQFLNHYGLGPVSYTCMGFIFVFQLVIARFCVLILSFHTIVKILNLFVLFRAKTALQFQELATSTILCYLYDLIFVLQMHGFFSAPCFFLHLDLVIVICITLKVDVIFFIKFIYHNLCNLHVDLRNVHILFTIFFIQS